MNVSLRVFLLLILLGLLAVLPAAAQDATTAACEAGFRLFDHERLATDPVCIPENPQRIISLDMPATEFLLLNDIPLVGVFGYAADEISAITPGLADDLAGIPTFDWPPNLELVTELDPDLIIAFKDSSLFYEGMAEIAPLVVYDAAYATDWKSSTAFWSQVFGKEAAYADMLATYEARVAELQAALGESRGEIAVSAFVPSPDYPMIWLIDSAQGVILQDVGLGRPEAQATTFAEGGYAEGGADYGFVAISNERLDLADGDEIFIFTWPSTDPEVMAQNIQTLEEFNANDPLWQTLQGVRDGNVHIVGPHWFRAQTYLAANLILDDLFTYLTAVEPTIPSPAAPHTAQAALDTPEAAFPVTIEHKFGSTTITEAPQRVVSLGFSEQDPLLALGVVPVAVRYWYGDESNAIFPWAEDEANGAQPVVLNMTFGSLNYEAILALDPDLISAVDSGITQEEYETLSQIAPTIAQLPDYIDFGMPWYETTRLIGVAVGKSAEAEVLISRVEGLFAEAREQNPQFAGKEIVVAYNYGEDRTYGYYSDQDIRGRFFTQLGFVVPDELNEIAGESFYADISIERIDLFDQDVLIFLGLQFAEGGQAAIEADPLISQLAVVQDGRVVYIPGAYDDALQFSTVLSLEYALEGVLPELQAVLSGD